MGMHAQQTEALKPLHKALAASLFYKQFFLIRGKALCQ
jgi:hypothetical protein